jgi:hypothetical protein
VRTPHSRITKGFSYLVSMNVVSHVSVRKIERGDVTFMTPREIQSKYIDQGKTSTQHLPSQGKSKENALRIPG